MLRTGIRIKVMKQCGIKFTLHSGALLKYETATVDFINTEENDKYSNEISVTTKIFLLY
jgi:hypothetical protein